VGGVLLHTGNYFFTPERAAAGDSLVVTDNRNRVLVYSVETGERKARTRPMLSRNGDRLWLGTGAAGWPSMICSQ
jgi:hypothetical protein